MRGLRYSGRAMAFFDMGFGGNFFSQKAPAKFPSSGAKSYHSLAGTILYKRHRPSLVTGLSLLSAVAVA